MWPAVPTTNGFQRRPFLIARSFRPGRCFALAGLRRGRSPLPAASRVPVDAGLPRSRGLTRLCRGPRLLSDARTRSRISVEPEVDLPPLHVDLDHLHRDLVAQPVHPSGLLAAQDVRRLDEPVVVVGHRRDVDQALDEVLDQLDEQAERASPR